MNSPARLVVEASFAHVFEPNMSASVRRNPVKDDVDQLRTLQRAPSPVKYRLLLLFATLAPLFDLFGIGVVLYSWNNFCDAPLRLWILIQVSLGTPMSLYLFFARAEFRSTFHFECMITLFSLFWSTLGAFWVEQGAVCQFTAPLLWWTCFMTTITTMAFLMGSLALVVVSTAMLMLLSGGRNPI